MPRSRKKFRRLTDQYACPGFHPRARVRGVFGDPKARVVTLVRRAKKRFAEFVVQPIEDGTTAARAERAICPAATRGFTSSSKLAVSAASAAAR
jgi:hypothetical protein